MRLIRQTFQNGWYSGTCNNWILSMYFFCSHPEAVWYIRSVWKGRRFCKASIWESYNCCCFLVQITTSVVRCIIAYWTPWFNPFGDLRFYAVNMSESTCAWVSISHKTTGRLVTIHASLIPIELKERNSASFINSSILRRYRFWLIGSLPYFSWPIENLVNSKGSAGFSVFSNLGWPPHSSP